MTESLISEEMRALVGRRFSEAISYPVDRNDIRRWALAAYYPKVPPRHFLDEDAALQLFGHGMVAPEDFNPFAWVTASPAPQERKEGFDPDWVEHQFGIVGPGSIANLNSGLETEYGERVKPGDVISRSYHIREYAEKDSSKMGRMLFTYIVAEYRNQDDQLVRRTTNLSIRYRGQAK